MFMQKYIGDLEPIIDQLHERVPFEGACEFPRSKNKKLDKFRRAQNVVYDLFNNGLMNRRGQWKQTMGISIPIAGCREQYHIRQDADYWDRIERRVAPTMRGIILDAAEEQGIKFEPTFLDLYEGENV